MLISRVLEVQNNDTVGAVRRFLLRLLDEEIADRLFAPVQRAGARYAQPTLIKDRDTVLASNPLLPVMNENAALALRDALRAESDSVVAAVLRPCEVRAVIELSKRGEIDQANLVIIGVDCLATYDEGYYRDVSDAHPDDEYWLMHQSLKYALIGQIAPYRYRTACQFCDRPAPDYAAADILIGLIGVDTGRKVLVLANEHVDERLKLHKVTDRMATEPETVEREVMVWRLAERRTDAAQRKLNGLGLQDANFGAIMGYLSRCTLCGQCLDACPLCTAELRAALSQGRSDFFAALIQQSQRLMSCAGCGMCQVNCPEDVPLAAIGRALGRTMQMQMHYVPGRSTEEPLPWQH